MNKKISQPHLSTESGSLGNKDIYQRVFDAIVDHKLLPGTHLKEDELCEVFDVGRTRMRSVLSQLAADHIVERVANRGVFVIDPSIDDAREVFRARRLIEGHLIRRAAENPDERLFGALSKHLRMEQLAKDTENIGVVIKRCGKYHQILADQADSPIMSRFLNELIARSSLIVAIYEAAPNECNLDEHKLLTELIVAGRADDAVILMEKHLNGIENRLDLSTKMNRGNELRVNLLG